MANVIKIKQSAVESKIPLVTDLALGELAVNTYDGKLYLKKSVIGEESIVEIGAGGGGSGTTTTISATPPTSPATGSLWWNSIEGKLKIYYFDGTSSQWVDASSNTFGDGSASGVVIDVLATAPILSSGGSEPVISITEATTIAAGSMSSADKTKLDGIATGATANLGTVTSVEGTGTVAGLSLSGTVTSSGSITLGGALSTPVNTISDSTTIGRNFVKLTNPSAVTYLRVNADNTLSTLDASTFRAAIGAGTSSTTGTVTSVGGTGTVAGLSLSGTVTGAGNLTLSGTLSTPISTISDSTTVGQNLVKLANPSEITFVRVNADNTVSTLDAATFRTAIGAGTSSTTGTVTTVTGSSPISSTGGSTPDISISEATTLAAGSMSAIDKTKLDGIADGATDNTGTVTAVGGTGTVAGISLSGTVTSSGDLTLGGTLSTPINTINDSTTVGQNLVKLTNPSAVTFVRVNADNTVSTLDATTFRTAIGAGTNASFSLAADTGTTETLTNGETLTFTGGTGINTSTGTNSVTFDVDTAVIATVASLATVATTGSYTDLADKPSIINIVDVATATGDIHGVIDRTASTLSFVDATRTFTIAPVSGSWTFYHKGTLNTISTSKSIVIANTSGSRFIRIDPTTLELVEGGSIPDFTNDSIVAYIYYDAVAGKGLIIGDERHGSKRDTTWHSNQHLNVGTIWRSGGALSYTLNTDSAITVAVGSPLAIADEDLLHTITHAASPNGFYQQILTGAASLEVIYLSGTTYTSTTQSTTPWLAGTSLARYNPISTGNGSLADATEGSYITYWLLATNDIRNPVKLVLGRELHASLDAAYAESFTEYGLSFAEQVFMYQIVLQTSASYLNAAKVVIAGVRKVTSKVASSISSLPATSHDNLTGRDTANSHPIAAITGLTAALASAGTVTSIGGTGTTAGLTLSGTVTTTGNLTLGGTLSTPINTINDSTTVGQNLVKLTNPSSITFLRVNADNTVSTLNSSTFRTAIGAGTGNGTVTSVTGTSPIASSGGITPDISIAQATTSTSGYVTSTDWNTFNNKQKLITVGITAPTSPSVGDLWVDTN